MTAWGLLVRPALWLGGLAREKKRFVGPRTGGRKPLVKDTTYYYHHTAEYITTEECASARKTRGVQKRSRRQFHTTQGQLFSETLWRRKWDGVVIQREVQRHHPISHKSDSQLSLRVCVSPVISSNPIQWHRIVAFYGKSARVGVPDLSWAEFQKMRSIVTTKDGKRKTTSVHIYVAHHINEDHGLSTVANMAIVKATAHQRGEV